MAYKEIYKIEYILFQWSQLEKCLWVIDCSDLNVGRYASRKWLPNYPQLNLTISRGGVATRRPTIEKSYLRPFVSEDIPNKRKTAQLISFEPIIKLVFVLPEAEK